MQAYLTAAAEISRLAVGDRGATAREATYPVTRWTSQREQVEGAPYGSRGGLSVVHTFPADGEYRFRVSFFHETTGALYGNGRAALHTAEAPEQIEISIDGERVALLDIDRWMNTSDPDGVNLRTELVKVTAGPHRVSARVRSASRRAGAGSDPSARVVARQHQHRRRLRIHDAAASARPRDHRTAGRDRSVRDAEPAENLHLPPDTAPRQSGLRAARSSSRLRSQAFRRPVDRTRSPGSHGASTRGAAGGTSRPASAWRSKASSRARGSYSASRSARRTRVPARPTRIDESRSRRRGSRSSCGRPRPTRSCCGSQQRKVVDAGGARAAGPADARGSPLRVLATRFAAQWLRLQDLDKIGPEVRTYPDFDEQLKMSMRRETELFFPHRARGPAGPRSVLRRLHVRRRAARQALRIPDVIGTGVPEGDVSGRPAPRPARPRQHPDADLARGSHLAGVARQVGDGSAARHAAAAAASERAGLSKRPAEADDGRLLNGARADGAAPDEPRLPVVPRVIDPLGLALENFDVSGAWRIKDNGMPIDAAGAFYDGTALTGPDGPEPRAAEALDRAGAHFHREPGDLRAWATPRLRRYADGAQHRARRAVPR